MVSTCNRDRICYRCGHTWAQHSQHRLDMIECDVCQPAFCEDFISGDDWTEESHV